LLKQSMAISSNTIQFSNSNDGGEGDKRMVKLRKFQSNLYF
jgi:hypothetical protein